MRAKTKGKHEMGKRFGIAAASVMVAAGLIGAVAATAGTIERPNGNKVTYRPMGEASSNVSLDIFGAIDRQGAVTYAFGGRITAQAKIQRVGFDPKGASVRWASGEPACREYRTVTLFRVEPNGTSTSVASVRTGQGTGEFGGPLLKRPLGEITGYYYVEVAPATRKLDRHGRFDPDGPGRPAPPSRVALFYKIGGGYYRALSCLRARSPTIFAEVPAGLSNSQ
jgi:hypothetical protein